MDAIHEDGDRSTKRRRLSDDHEASSASERESSAILRSSRSTVRVRSRIKPRSEVTNNHVVSVELQETEVSNGKVVDKKSSFATVDVAPWLLMSLAAMEIKRPTAIQKACIPEILRGRDVIGGSKTGSGKTIAFAVPMLQKLAENPSGIFGLVLTPTRELALQIYEQFLAISFRFELKAALITGGADWVAQTRALKDKPHLVIATPGRLADHIKSSGLDTVAGLKRVRMLILDEADRLLAEEAAMLPDVEVCLDAIPSDRQTCLFTATMTPEVMAIKDMPRKPGKQPVSVCDIDSADLAAVPTSLQLGYLMVPAQYRDAYLHVLLQTPRNKLHKSIIVFTNRTSTANVIERLLRKLDHNVTSLHSGLLQAERVANLSRFRAGVARILVATDVASRGLDISTVDLVVNYDIPGSADDYIHRVGRTARAGRSGVAIAMIGPRDEERVKAIEKRIKRQMVEYVEESINIETRVIRDSLKIVGESKREVLIGIEEGRDVRGNRTVGRLSQPR